jgi:hypothetical protein
MVSLPAAPDVRIARCRTLGLAGSALLAFSTAATGALPIDDPFDSVPVISHLRAVPFIALGLTFLGLTLLVGAWVRLGAVLKQDATRRLPRTPVHEMTTTLVWWTAPLLLAPPLYSRDVYSYLVQGAMFAEGWDPYRIAPVIFGGELADNVSPIWQHSTAPYGPVFLAIAAIVTMLAGYGLVVGILLMRLVMVGAVAAIAHCVAALARRYGVDPARALWLGVLNPLVLAHLVAGIHNDALMLALLLAGLLVAQRGRPVLGALLIGLATLVKAPAALALIFIVPAAARWLSARVGAGLGEPTGRRALLRGGALVGTVSVLTIGLFTAVTDSWYGWLGGLGDTVKVHNGLSLVTDIGRFYEWLSEVLGFTPAVSPITVARGVGALIVLGIIAALLYKLRGRPVLGVGLGLGAVVLLGPVVHPWYLLWAIVPIAASARDERLIKAVAALSVGMAFYPMPSGGGPSWEILAGIVGALVGIAYLRTHPLEGLDQGLELLRWRRPAGTGSGAVVGAGDHAGALARSATGGSDLRIVIRPEESTAEVGAPRR